jgi:hypothetical protein
MRIGVYQLHHQRVSPPPPFSADHLLHRHPVVGLAYIRPASAIGHKAPCIGELMRPKRCAGLSRHLCSTQRIRIAPVLSTHICDWTYTGTKQTSLLPPSDQCSSCFALSQCARAVAEPAICIVVIDARPAAEPVTSASARSEKRSTAMICYGQ